MRSPFTTPNAKILLALLLLLHVFSAMKAADDKNITISRQQERYSFEQNNGTVQVKAATSVVYRCNAYRTQISVAEFYNDQERIEEVRVFVNGDRNKNIRPVHEYYSVNNIFYSDARVCYFSLPFEKKDSESSVELEKTFLDPRYFTSIYFTESYDVEEKEVTVVIPRWMKADLKPMNFTGYRITLQKQYDSRNDADVYTYTARQLTATKRENMSPGPSHLYPHLLVLCKQADVKNGRLIYFNTLQDQYNWYHSLVKQIGNDVPVLKAKAQTIVNGITKEEDKIKAIYNWVQDNIRYIAFEDGMAGFKPDKAQEVLRKQYGDCKGMANLTKELLAGAGFDARLCWIGTNHIAYDYSTPNLSVDNHMICAVKWQGKFIFLDATETYIGLQQYADRIQGRQVLIENGEGYILEKIPLMPYTQNTETDKRNLKIEGDQLTGTITQTWSGESKEFLLSQAHSVKKEKLEEAFISYLSDGAAQYKISGFSLPDIKNWESQVQLKYQVQQSNAVAAFGNDIYLDADNKKEFADFKIDTAERKSPVEFSYKRHIVQETRIAIPVGYKTSALPAAVDISRTLYSFKLSYATENGQLVYRKEIALKESRLPVSAFKQWNEDIATLSKFYLEQINLSKQ